MHIFYNTQYLFYLISFKLAYIFNKKSSYPNYIASDYTLRTTTNISPKRYRFDQNNTLHCLRIHNACSSWTVTNIDVIICESQTNSKQLCHNNWKCLWSYPVWILNTQKKLPKLFLHPFDFYISNLWAYYLNANASVRK